MVEPGEHASELRSVYQRVLEAISTGDEGGLDGLLAPDLVDHNPTPDQDPGITGFKQWLRAARSSFPDLRASIEDVVVEGDRLAGRIRYRGTHRGSFLGVPATGVAVEFEAFHLACFNDCTIVEWWGVADLLNVLNQIGATVRSGAG